MNRRRLLVASLSASAVVVPGCGSRSAPSSDGTGSDENASSSDEKRRPDFRSAVFLVNFVEPVPDSATVLPLRDTELVEIDRVENAVSAAASQREEFVDEHADRIAESAEEDGSDGVWFLEIVTHGIEDIEEYRELKSAYETLPTHENRDIPFGAYVKYDGDVYLLQLVEEH